MIQSIQRNKGERGSIMLVTVTSLIMLLGMLGLSVDVGRIYIAKNEAQAFADLAAVVVCEVRGRSRAAAPELGRNDSNCSGRCDVLRDEAEWSLECEGVTDPWCRPDG